LLYFDSEPGVHGDLEEEEERRSMTCSRSDLGFAERRDKSTLSAAETRGACFPHGVVGAFSERDRGGWWELTLFGQGLEQLSA
jgi:hypothetical protein